MDLPARELVIPWRVRYYYQLVRPGRIGTTSFDVHFAVRRAGTETCAARVVYVAIARDGTGKIAVPDIARNVLLGDAGPDETDVSAPAR